MNPDTLQWLLESDEPWTRYRTLVDLLDRPPGDPAVQAARADMLAHPQVQESLAAAASWPGYPIQRHNDANHPIHKLGLLVDFGIQGGDASTAQVIDGILAHQSPEGAFLSLVKIPPAFGGSGEDQYAWLPCDAPLLLHALLAHAQPGGHAPAQVVRAKSEQAVRHLASLVEDNGWRCRGSAQIGKFRGPGRKSDPCPIANLYALKALSQAPEMLDSPAAKAGVQMILGHWERRAEVKFYLFGMGSDFCKLKYPFVWYDILHVADVLSRFPCARGDPRLAEIVSVITAQANEQNRYTAGSAYLAWKGWSFAGKKIPSPWLTFLVLRIQGRLKNE